MYEHFSKRKSDVWNDFLRRREKGVYRKKHRDNVLDFIDLLANYMPKETANPKLTSSKVYEFFSKSDGVRPCGFAVSIAIDKLPRKLKK